MKWRYILTGDVIAVRGRDAEVVRTAPNGQVTIMLGGQEITRRPDPDRDIAIVKPVDPDAPEDLREIARIMGGTLDDAERLVLRVYLSSHPGECAPYDDMTASGKAEHMVWYHNGQHDHTSDGIEPHTHREA